MKPTYKELQKKVAELEKELAGRPQIEFHPTPQIRNLRNYIDDPTPENMFYVAQEYEAFGQTASAIGFYHQCAERTNNDALSYECLLRMSICYREQGDRKAHEKNSLLMAIALIPDRPEAYFLLSLVCERIAHNDDHQRWWDSYTYACIGESVADNSHQPLQSDIDYYGPHFFLFQKAVTLWWVGRCDESRELFQQLSKRKDYPKQVQELIEDNLVNLMNNKGRYMGK